MRDQLKLRHILVPHEFEAKDIERLIASGKNFSELATKYSTCPSSKEGGSLGLVQPRRLDPDFREAAEALKVGEVSKVVRTRFGYHLILREA